MTENTLNVTSSGWQWVTMMSHNYVIFSVQSCVQGIIMLTPATTVQDFDTIEINMGNQNGYGLTITELQTGIGQAYTDTSLLVDCDTKRPYWIYWKDNTMTIGKGEALHSNTVVTFTSSFTLDFGSLGFTSISGYNSIWSVISTGCKYLQICTCTFSSNVTNTKQKNSFLYMLLKHLCI